MKASDGKETEKKQQSDKDEETKVLIEKYDTLLDKLRVVNKKIDSFSTKTAT